LYAKKRQALFQRTSLPVVALALIMGCTLLYGLYWLCKPKFLEYRQMAAVDASVMQTRVKIEAAWAENRYADIIADAGNILLLRPVDPAFLSMRGIAEFYHGMQLEAGNDQLELMQSAILDIRKALIIGVQGQKPQLLYLLGKAYFHKDYNHYDAAIMFFNQALSLGYESDDIWEYLAIMYRELGQLEKSISYFELAVAINPENMALLLSASKVFIQAGFSEKALQYASQVMEQTADQFLFEQAGLLLASIYLEQEDYAAGLAILNTIKERDSNSADVWYYEGLIYQKMDDNLKARAAWRKAVSIDPMHIDARMKLNERT